MDTQGPPPAESPREGNLQAPDRQPIGWRQADYHDQAAVDTELARVFDICHGCRRCVNLCQAFPTLFDLVDESPTMEVDGVAAEDYGKVAEQCYLCDLCAETKCPYLPPHPWAVDFPHLMLRAKAARFKAKPPPWRDRLITSTDAVFGALAKRGVAAVANAAAGAPMLRRAGEAVSGLHRDAPLPPFAARPAAKRLPTTVEADSPAQATAPAAGGAARPTTGKVAIYLTCYGNHSCPEVVEDLVAVLCHNGVHVRLMEDARCCAMPKLELGDLDRVAAAAKANLPVFAAAIDDGCDLMAVVPSCVLMYRQEVPLLLPESDMARRVGAAFFDPFEYLMLRHKAGLLRTDFKRGLGKVAYQAACHQRVQNIGMKTREFLGLVDGTEVVAIERCSGHDGTYGTRRRTYGNAMRIARPVANRVRQAEADRFGSDCPMAGRFVAHAVGDGATAEHPVSMARTAYGI